MGEGEGGMIWGNGMETCIISYKKRIASPGLIQDAWGWCTGMTRRDGTGREVGGGFRMGTTRMPVADSCRCVAEPIQYCKVISLQLKEINLNSKKKKKVGLHQIKRPLHSKIKNQQNEKTIYGRKYLQTTH